MPVDVSRNDPRRRPSWVKPCTVSAEKLVVMLQSLEGKQVTCILVDDEGHGNGHRAVRVTYVDAEGKQWTTRFAV